MIRVLYLGQKWIGERCFGVLLRNRDMRICGAVSNDTPEVWWGTNGIVKTCVKRCIPFVSNSKRNNDEISRLISEQHADVIISVQHPWILPAEILAQVGYQAYNLHNARLPDYQGHNCCNHAILNGEQSYTSTIHMLTDDVDAGDIVLEKTFSIEPRETARGLYGKALLSGQEIFQELIDKLSKRETIHRKPIVGSGTFYSRHSIDGYREIKDISNTSEVDRKIRALYFPPFEPAFYVNAGRKVYVLPECFQHFSHEFKCDGRYV